VKDQNWFAVILDFIIVVVGVFIGLQVSNWNDGRTFDNKETVLLHELKKEMENSIVITNHKIDSYTQVSEAGKRSLDFLSSNVSCGTECWPILVDFMHASQWQGVNVKRSSYENMRGIGLPRNNQIIEAVDANLAQVDANVLAYSDKPYYRAVVRQLVSHKAQEFYWKNCHFVSAGVETYDLKCPKGITDDLALELVEAIAKNLEIKPHLTQWFGVTVHLPITLKDQNISAEVAIAAIDSDLKNR
jgi:hypothetical protein